MKTQKVRSNWTTLLFTCIMSCALFMTSCHPYKKQIPTGESMAIDNVFINPNYEHAKILNLLVLPMDNPHEDKEVGEQQEKLVSTLLRNFGKFNYFNVFYDKDITWKVGQVIDLETGKMDRVRVGALGEEYNAEAVLKVSVAEYRAYPPMRMKVKGAIFDTKTGERIWSFDHVFDTDDTKVVNGLRRWWNTRMAGGMEANRFEFNKLRPSFFTSFVFYSMADSYGKARVAHTVAQEKLREEMMELKKKRIQEGERSINNL